MKVNTFTTWGKSHLAEISAAKQPLKISHIKVGDGSITSIDQALALTELVNYKKSYPITGLDKQNNITNVKACIDNIGLADGFTVKEIGIYVEHEGVQYLFWYINNDNDVSYIHAINNGVMKVDATYQIIFAGSDVEVLNTYELDYFVSRRYLEQYCLDLGKVIVGETPPATPKDDVLWIHTEDKGSVPPEEGEEPDEDEERIQLMMKALQEMQGKVDTMEYLLFLKFDPGVRQPKPEPDPEAAALSKDHELDPSYPENDEDYYPNMGKYLADVLAGKICIARGERANMGNLFPGEPFYEIKEKALYIGDENGGVSMLCKVGGGGGSGGGNLTGEYVELISPKGEPFKITVTDAGKLEIYKSSIDKMPLPNPSEPGPGDPFRENWDTYKDDNNFGLCINQIYSGGKLNEGVSPVSHSFIEIYNNSERDISLRGLSVQYAKTGSDWKVCKLDGVLPGNTSYLIRCLLNNNPYKLSCRLKIKEFDMDWNQELSPTGMKVALVVGTDPLTTENPYRDPVNGVPSIYPYIDMLGAGGKEPTEKVDYVEGYFARHCLDKNTSICRRFRAGKKDGDNNLLDTEAIDYRYCNLDYYAPRCKADGPWDIYRDKLKISDARPNMVFITFGKEQSTRIFTWQTTPTEEGYVKLYKLSDTVFENGKYVKKEIPGYKRFKSHKSEIRNISHHDTPACVHKVFIKDLTPGVYIYKVGEEGKWSDENEFEVFHNNYGDFTSALAVGEQEADRSIRFVQTSDQQGWDAEEYKCWKHAADFIRKNEKLDYLEANQRPNYEWRLNTGDASQNGNRSYEWRYYYNAAKDDLVNTVEMSVAGNNDLVDKKKAEAYNYYTTYEDSPYPSVYEYFIGDVHFIGLHAWCTADTDFVDLDGSDGFLKAQLEWLGEKLRGPRKRWTVVFIHVAPYTVVKQKQGQPFGPLLAGNDGEFTPVDVVLCGHNHAYSRTKAMLHGDVVDPMNGAYHVMCQATGYKLKGKKGPNPAGEVWYGVKEDGSASVSTPPNPTYILWEITKDYIQMDAYMVSGIVHKDATTGEISYGNPEDFVRDQVDTFKIWHRDKRAEHPDEI